MQPSTPAIPAPKLTTCTRELTENSAARYHDADAHLTKNQQVSTMLDNVNIHISSYNG